MSSAVQAAPARAPRGWRRWTPWRRLCQPLVALFYLLLPWVNARGYRQVFGTLASLKLGPIDLTEPAAGLAALFAARGVQTAVLLGMAPVIALALVAGPVFCSWVCPWGLLSEGLDRLRQRLRPRPWGQRPWVRVRRLRWVTLAAVLLGGALLAVPLCHLHCPWGIDPRQAGRFDGCSNCMVCVDGCPSGALQPGWGAPAPNRPTEGADARPRPRGGEGTSDR